VGDLVTHLCSALLPAAFLPRSRYTVVVALGTVLPDLGSRVIPIGLDLLFGSLLPDEVWYPFGVLHDPAALVLTCGLVALVFVEEQRRAVFGALLIGCALHLGLDLLQDHHGQGYFLLFPASTARFELGWIGSEDTVYAAAPLAALTSVVWAIRLWAVEGGRSEGTP
jgi:hypothetical protein